LLAWIEGLWLGWYS